MKKGDAQFSGVGFVGRYILPLFLIFLIPVISLLFFRHVQSYFDAEALAAIEKQINADTTATPQQKERALKQFRQVPVSALLASSRPGLDELKAGFTVSARRDYFIFRWMIRLAKFCIATGILAFVVAGVSVLISLRSQMAQYLSLLTGWHVLRLIATLQVAAQGLMGFALSYWLPVFYAERFSPKLVLIMGLMFVAATAIVIVAVFKRPDMTFPVEGRILDDAGAAALLEHLGGVAASLGTEKPNQIIAGIDDNFFVTEHTVKVGDRTVDGKTLFVSLALLRNITRGEANAVLAHEMAHFSGSDTVYSKKISPLLSRYAEYLKALHAGGVSRPIFYFMFAFWNLYQLSIQRLSRQREFRADAVAARQTSPANLANALIKIATFSRYRAKVEEEIFKQEQVLEDVNIPAQVAQGFAGFVRQAVADSDLGESTTTHPFDSHPPMRDRFAAVGLADAALDEQTLLAPVEDSWYDQIPGADKIEAELWQQYQDQFKQAHEVALAYRYWPANEQEEAIVLKHFPGVEFVDKKGNRLAINYKHVHFSKWSAPIGFDDVVKCTASESLGTKYLTIQYAREGKKADEKFALSGFPEGAEAILEHFKQYYTRHLASREFQKERQKGGEEPPDGQQ